MDKFPPWARSWLAPDPAQVSHGLNLALKLASPSKLPLMLWDIVVAQPKIERALQELSFLHFARFVPSWDGKALMVTTSFDGPLEPYVMDFVIALGDVFDALLLYVEDAPPLPVREYPEEFMDFVRCWNRVPLAPRNCRCDAVLLPPDFPFPIFSAYPGKTVTDIAGKRRQLLSPSTDHPGGPVELADVQANILNGYRAQTAVYLFFSITDADLARKWLADVFAGQGAWSGVIRADRQIEKKQALIAQLGFTFAGLETLLPDRRADLERFPVAFREGALRRSEANGDVGPSDPRHWRLGRAEQDIHLMVVLYSSEPYAARTIYDTFIDETGVHQKGLREVLRQNAHALPKGYVYFGYRDSIAQPRISGQCKPETPDFQPAASPGEFLLGKDYKNIFGGSSLGNLPADLATNGSFGALRMMEQDLEAFERTIKHQAARLSIGDELLRAKLLGRWRDGEPLSLCPQALGATGPSNAFDYAPSWEHPGVFNDHEGTRCPVGAHIRRTNPRSARVAGQRHSRRLIRRGMPIRWVEDGVGKRGLMGLFIGASLERQFEFIQRQWIQGGDAASGIRGTQDPLAGLRSKPVHMELPGVGGLEVPPLVTTRGSLYLFFPGIAALTQLEEAASRMNAPARPPADEPRLTGLASLPAWMIALGTRIFLCRLHSKCLADFVATYLPPPRRDCSAQHARSPGGIRMRDAGFIADPFPAYKKLRNAGRRVVWVKEHKAFWVLSRPEARKVLEQHEQFLQAQPRLKLRGLITLDGTRHGVVRSVAAAALRASAASIAPLVSAEIKAALAAIGGVKQFDFMSAYGARVPLRVLWRLVGLTDATQITACQRLVQTMISCYGQPERPGATEQLGLYDASLRLGWRLGCQFAKAWLRSLIPIGESRHAHTLIGELAARTQLRLLGLSFPPCRPLRFLEALVTLVQFALAGQSASFLLGTATRNLMMPDPRRPQARPWDALAALRTAQPAAFDAKLAGALEEARRIDPPVTIAERYAATDLQLDGVDIPEGSAVFVVIGSANRDGVAGPHAECFVWDRYPGAGHLSFGHGVHECIGQFVQARIVPEALASLIGAMPTLRLCDPDAVPPWVENVYFRALQALPVTRCP